MAIEVEKHGRLSEQVYDALFAKIKNFGGMDLGENNTDTIFYVIGHAQAKVQHAVSKGTAKIAWKSGGIDGSDSREEIEVRIPPEELSNANKLLERLMPESRKFITSQRRHDFELNGAQIALKYSDDWGFHIELERMVASQDQVADALHAIDELAKQLDVTLLTRDEEKAFVEKKIADLSKS